MGMISQSRQGTAAQGQRPGLVAIFFVALAGAAVAIAIAWTVFGASSPSAAAPERTTIQVLQDPGLLDQRSGERGGAVALPKSAPGNPYVNIHVPKAEDSILEPGLREHRRGERAGN